MKAEFFRQLPKKLPPLPALRVLMIADGRIAGTGILSTIFEGLQEQGAINYLCFCENDTTYAERVEAIKWSDAVFFFRAPFPQTLSLLRMAKELGKATIYSTDDDFFFLDKDTPLGKVYHDPENISAYKALFREADLIWLFTEEMAKRYRALNDRIILGNLPNPLDFIPHPSGLAPEDQEVYTIGYSGSFVHEQDLRVVVKPLIRLLETPGLNLWVEFVGYSPREFVGHPRVRFLPYFDSLKGYYDYMIRARWTMGLALLEDTPFNRGKTNNKYREYAAFGIPTIYSDMPVYSSCVKHRVNGYLAPHTEEGMSEALQTMINEPALRRDIRRGALQEVTCNYSLKAAQLQLLGEISRLAIRNAQKHGNRPKLLVIGYDKAFSTHIDALQPCRELQKKNLLSFTWREPGQVKESDINDVACIYLVRAFEALNLPVLEWAKEKQIPLICSWDDNFFLLPAETPLGQFYSKPEVREIMEKFLRECSLIMASTAPLAYHSRTFNPSVMEAIYGMRPPDPVEENQQPFDFNPNKVRVGFFGVNQAINAPFMIEALKGLRQRYQDHILIETIGLQLCEEYRGIIDRHFDIVWEYNDALRLLKDRRWDIGLAPLIDNEYNASKQATKFRDYAWCGSAIVASDVPTYRRVIIDGIHGILVENTPSAWIEAISSLIENPEKKRFITTGGARLLNNVHMQDKTISSWYQLIWRMMKFKWNKIQRNQHDLEGARVSSPPHQTVDYPSFPPFLGPPLKNCRTYRLSVRQPNWNRLDVLMSTHQQPVSGLLNLRVYSESGHLMRDISVELEQTRDGTWTEMHFTPISNSVGQCFILKFTSRNMASHAKISFYEDNPYKGRFRRLLGRMGFQLSGKQLYCRLGYGR